MVLALPDLNVEGRCHFSETHGGDTWGVEDEEGACAAVLGRIAGRPLSLSEFNESLDDDHGFPLHRKAARGPCPDTGVTRDHRLEKETCEKYHLSVWNRNRVMDELTENIRSLETGQQVGAVEETTHNSVQSRFADQNGHYYLLVMEGGTRLKVYEIKT